MMAYKNIRNLQILTFHTTSLLKSLITSSENKEMYTWIGPVKHQIPLSCFKDEEKKLPRVTCKSQG